VTVLSARCTGGTTLADDATYVQGIVAEEIGTFLLVTAVMALAVDSRAPAGWAGFMIGLAVAAAILVIGPLTGASLNPARTFGPLLVTTIGGGDTEWGDLPPYIVGPLAGGGLAAIAYDTIARPRAVEVALTPIGGDERAVEPAATPPAAGNGGEAGREPPLRPHSTRREE
jgi:glycerol uptake facilitator protein